MSSDDYDEREDLLEPLRWRVNGSPPLGFDELVVHSTVDGPCLIHAEMMSKRAIFVSIGPLRVWAFVNDDGVVEISGTERDE